MTTLSAKADSFLGHARSVLPRYVPTAQSEPQDITGGVDIPLPTTYVKRYHERRYAPIPLSPEGDSPLGATMMGKSERDVNAVTNTLLSGLEQPTKQESPGFSHGEAQESNETLWEALKWLASLALNHDDVPCPPYIENCVGYWGGGHGQCIQCLVDWALAEAKKGE